MNVTIRLARPDELKTIQDLNYELFVSDHRHFGDLNLDWPYEPEGRAYFEELISGDGGVCYVAEINETIVGYLAGAIMRKHSAYRGVRVELENMYVKEAFRSASIGGQLIKTFFEWTKKIQADYVMVNAFTPNVRAIEFYQKNGFEPYSMYLRRAL